MLPKCFTSEIRKKVCQGIYRLLTPVRDISVAHQESKAKNFLEIIQG